MATNSTRGIRRDRQDQMPEASGSGDEGASPLTICILATISIAASALFGYTLICFWPLTSGKPPVPYFGSRIILDPLLRMFVVAAAGGALGGNLRTMTSLYRIAGNHALMRNWGLRYLMLPLVGASVGLIVYIVLRAALVSPQPDNTGISPFGFCTLSILAGAFSEQILAKVHRVTEILLAEPWTDDNTSPANDPISDADIARRQQTPFGTEIPPVLRQVPDPESRDPVQGTDAAGIPAVTNRLGSAPARIADQHEVAPGVHLSSDEFSLLSQPLEIINNAPIETSAPKHDSEN